MEKEEEEFMKNINFAELGVYDQINNKINKLNYKKFTLSNFSDYFFQQIEILLNCRN